VFVPVRVSVHGGVEVVFVVGVSGSGTKQQSVVEVQTRTILNTCVDGELKDLWIIVEYFSSKSALHSLELDLK